ncbi:gamma-glutamylcyclotransferase [Kiloniella sp. b19]|uniref:gamma-glutamylcyclotransferase n=1 Tax=Kiloniella sp. GXU_MW_B19 TaxID=3141326 RepID=UPI0031D1A1EF
MSTDAPQTSEEEYNPLIRDCYDPDLLPWDGTSDIWIFGYGSLMWNPGFDFSQSRPATLQNYHRSFCIQSHVYRGTPEKPGLVLGLDEGGSCFGMGYRVTPDQAVPALDYLFRRELVTGVYLPRWCDMVLDSGEKVRCATFVADRRHYQYAGNLKLDELVFLALQGRGTGGTCVDYIRNTVEHLRELGIRDEGLEELLAAVETAG